ncbi:MAG: DUF4080 domain-containing protein [Myxococcales bacterium]|nr:DUF4080 domain-containing protein [Myxococcales bacterium]
MADILLCSLNAKFAHSSLGLRYLYANLGEVRARAEILEFIWNERPCDLVESILRHEPKIVGLGVYIWNAVQTLEVVRILKSVRPEVVVVLGGPEVSHESELQEIVALADYTVKGEGEVALASLAKSILVDGQSPAVRIIEGGTPKLDDLVSPYAYYGDMDVEKRSIYVEASRGCPFRCEFCLSSLDLAVRQFPLQPFLADMKVLIDRGVRQFKFIDRTFNLSPRISSAILEFFLEHVELGLFIHFEMVPDRLPRALREAVAKFPEGSIQFEIGIQTFDEGTSERISRVQDLERLADNMEFLTTQTHVHIHADLIIGLPGEDMESFARGFDRLVGIGPHEVQVGILKRLRGTAIIRHSEAYEMVYSAVPPYEILQNNQLSFETLSRLKRFARSWDLVANRGNFQESCALLWNDCGPFKGFLRFSDWLFEQVGHFTGIALDRLVKLMLEYLTMVAPTPIEKLEAAQVLGRDYTRSRGRVPSFLADITGESTRFRPVGEQQKGATPKRQARHLPTDSE